jgi:hypothetical protein
VRRRAGGRGGGEGGGDRFETKRGVVGAVRRSQGRPVGRLGNWWLSCGGGVVSRARCVGRGRAGRKEGGAGEDRGDEGGVSSNVGERVLCSLLPARRSPGRWRMGGATRRLEFALLCVRDGLCFGAATTLPINLDGTQNHVCLQHSTCEEETTLLVLVKMVLHEETLLSRVTPHSHCTKARATK